MNTITLGEIKSNVQDLTDNFDVTTIDKGNYTRQINRAIEYIQARLGLPSDKDTFDFFYYQDTMYYDCPEAFNELIQLYYNSTYSDISVDYNTPARRWNIVKDTELLRSTGNFNAGISGAGYQWNGPSQNRVALTTINGKNQLLVQGFNANGISILNNFDNVSPLTFSADISGAVADSNVKKQGSASTKFSINAGLTASTISFTNNWNIQDLITRNGALRMYVDFPTLASITDITSVEVRLISTTSNYYSMTETNQVDGSAWAVNSWSWLNFALSAATTVGTPDAQSITQVEVIFNHANTVSVANLRVDYLYVVVPDYLTCSYYSFYKGTDTTGATKKVTLTDDTDICSFGAIAPGLIGVIAMNAAIRLFPQLRGDLNFVNLYRAEEKETLQLYGRTWGRHRSTGGAGQTEILR